MADFDERYEIRQATVEDIPAIMDYIEDDWRSGHIMARNREFFEYEFLEDDGNVNVIIAIDKTKNTIEGMIGYLCASKDPDKKDIWGSIWKVRDGNVSLLGAEIMKRLETISGCRYNLGTGANPKTNIPLMRVMFRRKANKMKHYYLVNEKPQDGYKIAKIVNAPEIILNDEDCSDYKVVPVSKAEELSGLFEQACCKEAVPYKDVWYIDKKFFKHPIHKYEIYGIKNGDQFVGMFVMRLQEANGSKCYRMVDYIGDFEAIKYTKAFWTKFMNDNRDVEFVDFYCLGMDDEDMLGAGFSLLADEDANIIPNYFAPFCQQNIDIWVHYPVEGVTFTKADGDQDRPN